MTMIVLSEGNCSSSNGLVRKDMATPMLISSSSSSTASTCTTLSTSPDSSILFNHQPTVARGDAGKAFLGTSFGKTVHMHAYTCVYRGSTNILFHRIMILLGQSQIILLQLHDICGHSSRGYADPTRRILCMMMSLFLKSIYVTMTTSKGSDVRIPLLPMPLSITHYG